MTNGPPALECQSRPWRDWTETRTVPGSERHIGSIQRAFCRTSARRDGARHRLRRVAGCITASTARRGRWRRLRHFELRTSPPSDAHEEPSQVVEHRRRLSPVPESPERWPGRVRQAVDDAQQAGFTFPATLNRVRGRTLDDALRGGGRVAGLDGATTIRVSCVPPTASRSRASTCHLSPKVTRDAPSTVLTDTNRTLRPSDRESIVEAAAHSSSRSRQPLRPYSERPVTSSGLCSRVGLI